MKPINKEKLIVEGQELLKKGIFPDDLLSDIKEKRLRKEISDKIFYKKHVKFEDLSEEEKRVRKLRMKVKLSFVDYLQSFMLFSNLSYLLLIIGIITWFTSITGANSNGVYGIISMFLGALLLVISLSKEKVLAFTKIALIIYSIATLLEIIFFGIPERYLSPDREVRITLLMIILNEISPYFYLIVRLMGIGMLFKVKKNQETFQQAKNAFENPLIVTHNE